MHVYRGVLLTKQDIDDYKAKYDEYMIKKEHYLPGRLGVRGFTSTLQDKSSAESHAFD